MTTFDQWWDDYSKHWGKNTKEEIAQSIDVIRAAWNAALTELGHCECKMAAKLLGDGCSVCNPTMKREIDAYNEGYNDGLTEAAEVARKTKCDCLDYPCGCVYRAIEGRKRG